MNYEFYAFRLKKHHNQFNRTNTFFFITDTIGANNEKNLYAHAQGLPKKM